ncbi:beta-ketoacyl-[acyl-carrier-protein] synthase family protein [Galactobacter caseinivorans]|uniref:Beta-ketoacyl-[acyl-carrier-protein] synthase family protein n=1 Tax=Galactobacter caseinivorans TaxID=2676123 RepID=A0A496PIU3_9MICC|nr:beta-ketoacyl-[acyl-carrier-protein] synthase family protein [Galactobacter caseinivorans]RKW70404.1 beta-ketoacyl-[acyl-carrier-protein] synthase family protein [Galactobacter caseinivorans]
MAVVVTGLGAVSPLGANVEELWEGLLQGRSGITELKLDPALFEQPRQGVGQVSTDLSEILGRAAAKRLDRQQQLALVAALEAWADAGSPEVDGDRMATSIGTGVGGLLTTLSQEAVLNEKGARRVSPRTVPQLMANAASAQISMAYGARAGVYTPVSACAAGAEAIAHGARLIESGEADVVIAGGTEAAIAQLTVAAFAQTQALAAPAADEDLSQFSRPFAEDRKGFVLGEGAGVVILESAAHAVARGARIHAHLAGWGITSDAFHITSSDPAARGQRLAIEKALRQSGLSPAGIKQVNAHATGTSVGDASEALALSSTGVAGVDGGAAVTAIKGATGHLVGAAGAVEAIVSIRQAQTGLVPPTAHLSDSDPACGLDVVRGQPRDVGPGAVLSNSFGFGGQNVSLIFTV